MSGFVDSVIYVYNRYASIFDNYNILYNQNIILLFPMGILIEVIAMGVFCLELKRIPKTIEQNYVLGEIVAVDKYEPKNETIHEILKMRTIVTIKYQETLIERENTSLLKDPKIGDKIRLYQIIDDSGMEILTPWIGVKYHKWSKRIAILWVVFMIAAFLAHPGMIFL